MGWGAFVVKGKDEWIEVVCMDKMAISPGPKWLCCFDKLGHMQDCCLLNQAIRTAWPTITAAFLERRHIPSFQIVCNFLIFIMEAHALHRKVIFHPYHVTVVQLFHKFPPSCVCI